MTINEEEKKKLQEQTSGYQANPYQESDLVKQAQTMIQNQLAQKPGAYQSAWQTQLNDVLQKIQNREKFSFDLNGDALYNQYKNNALTQGKMAMMDTMGQAQAMTGGYGNSYAQSVGQQAYQGQLQQLNDKIPELYQLALSKYQQEGSEMKDQASMLAQMENLDYGRYRDTVSDYNSELNRLQNRYDTERDYDYGMWADNRDFAYQQNRDQVADEQWQKEFDFALQQYNDKQNKKRSGGNPDPDVEPQDGENYSTIKDDCNALIASGARKSEIKAYLDDEYHNQKSITQSEYNKLKAIFAPDGIDYT